MIEIYLLFGLGHWAGTLSQNPDTFEKSTFMQLLVASIMAMFLWPIGLITQIFCGVRYLKEKEKFEVKLEKYSKRIEVAKTREELLQIIREMVKE